MSRRLGQGSLLSDKDRQDLSQFISMSVLPATSRTYDRHWQEWKTFLNGSTKVRDPLLPGVSEEDKSALVGLFLMQRYQTGLRAKGATAVTAGLRMHFARNLVPTAFLDAAVIATTRSSCRLNPTELRNLRNHQSSDTVKLPACHGMLVDMRACLWTQQPWVGQGLLSRMAYLGCVWGFDQSARISEYTVPEPRAQDHCIRLDDLSFFCKTPEGTVSWVGSVLALRTTEAVDESAAISNIIECRVQGASSKGKRVVKAKLIGRRSPEEALFLSELAFFICRSGAKGTDELFSVRTPTGIKTALTGRTVRDQIKASCKRLGLPPNYFTSHSLRKGAITYMRANGASEDDRRDRGNYAPGSEVMNSTYDYATGLGPLASNSLPNAQQPTITDLQRILPAVRPVPSNEA